MILLIVFLFILSAFFSASEVAFFSISKIKIKRLRNNLERINKLFNHPRQLLITILLCNTLVNVVIASIAATVAIKIGSRYFENLDIIVSIEIIIVTIFILIFGELLPKIFAYSIAEKFAKFSSSIIIPLRLILLPIVYILEWMSNLIATKKSYDITSDDIKNVFTSEHLGHPLDKNEKRMIQNIFRFNSINAQQIMIPRVDISAVEREESIKNLKKFILDSGHSRIPVFNKVIDNIIGFVYVKDLILADKEVLKISHILRRPIFVTESTKIDGILNIFKKQKTHIAVVLDEYGGTSGIITMEDILEEIVGEILDEYDNEIAPIVKNKDKSFNVSGMCSIAKFDSKIGINVQNKAKHSNIAELLMELLNRVPHKGEILKYDNKEFIFSEIKSKRIVRFVVRLMENVENL